MKWFIPKMGINTMKLRKLYKLY
uniref:Uncharacterized protein n=1 Tax=Rhizophora mucronata TaxID=61149 RepID=A0A2P2QCR8_RHIMU